MTGNNFLNKYNNRRMIGAFVSIFIASIFSYYFSFSHTSWMVIGALMVGLTSRTATVRQALLFLIMMVLGLGVAVFLLQTSPLLGVACLVLFWFVSDIIIRFSYSQYKNNLNILFLFYIIYSINIYLQEASMVLMSYQIMDMIIGAMIGLLGVLIFPENIIKDFKDGMSLLMSRLEYNTLLLANFFENKASVAQVVRATDSVDDFVQVEGGAYPEWVYDAGFNRALRSGHRFFLVNLDRVIEIMHSFNAMLPEFDTTLFKEIMPAFAKSMAYNQQIFSLLQGYFETGKKQDLKMDLKDDIVELEKTVQHYFPLSYDLIEISPQFYLATALLREITDLRQLLLKLLLALPD